MERSLPFLLSTAHTGRAFSTEEEMGKDVR